MRIERVGLPLMAAALLASGCAPKQADYDSSGQARQPIGKPTTAKVERRDVTGYEFLLGELYTPPEAEGLAYATHPGPVERVYATVGERVRRGEVIVQLAIPDVRAYYEQARANVVAARSALEQARAQYGASARAAKQALDQARATERTIRQSTLPGGDATALNDAIAQRVAAEDALEAAQKEQNALVAPYLYQVQAAERALAEAAAGVKIATIESPISGTILELNAAPGKEVGTNPKVPVARIVDLAAIKVKCEVRPEQHELVERSRHVYIRFASFPDKVFDGHVRWVRALPGEKGARVVHEAMIELDNDAGLVKPGMKVQSVGVKIGEAHDAIAVPVGAVDRDASAKAFVMVEKNGQWSRTPVELGLSAGDYVVVKSGLEVGQTVQVITGRNEVVAPQ